MKTKKKNIFPKGWNEKRVQEVLRYYESQSDEDAAREDDEAFAAGECTVMEVPLGLVSKVRKLIAQDAGKTRRSLRWRSKKAALRT